MEEISKRMTGCLSGCNPDDCVCSTSGPGRGWNQGYRLTWGLGLVVSKTNRNWSASIFGSFLTTIGAGGWYYISSIRI